MSSIQSLVDTIDRKAVLCRDLIDGMLLYHHTIKQEELYHIEKGVRFNVFELWNRFSGLGENIHSRLIHFLLSPDPLHGQKDLFLNELLSMLNITDIASGSSWTVTAEIGRVDVMIKRVNPESVIILENKSNWANDKENQLYRYWYQNIHKCPEDRFKDYYIGKGYRIVYLSPREEKQLSENSLQKPPLDWFSSQKMYDSLPDRLPLDPLIWSFDKEFACWLQKCIEVTPPENYALREYIRQYKNYCKTL